MELTRSASYLLTAFLLATSLLWNLNACCRTTNKVSNSNPPGVFAIAATRSTMTFRRYMVLVAVMVTAAFGDTFLSAGMREVGPVSIHHLSTLLTALKVPWVLAGIVLLTAFFASYLAALSWADLTFVLPATSFGYVIIALLSRFWLHETISPERWAGILLITLGVGFVTQGPSYTENATGIASIEQAVDSPVSSPAKERSA